VSSEQTQEQLKDKISKTMCDYHNAIYQVCKEGGSWIRANDLLADVINLQVSYREMSLVSAKMALEKAFTPRLKRMLDKKLNGDNNEE
tara:strand:- start:380 stop:643 length:264 start_codon:yes stop_codon:yes gene_type:complete